MNVLNGGFRCNIILIFSHLYKIICYNAEITLKHLNLFITQVCNLKQIHFVVIYIGL